MIKECGRRHGEVTWLCQCDCGTQKVKKGAELRGGYSQSCGCSRKDGSGETKPKQEWYGEHSIKRSTFSSRINKLGWTPEEAVYTPVRSIRHG